MNTYFFKFYFLFWTYYLAIIYLNLLFVSFAKRSFSFMIIEIDYLDQIIWINTGIDFCM